MIWLVTVSAVVLVAQLTALRILAGKRLRLSGRKSPARVRFPSVNYGQALVLADELEQLGEIEMAARQREFADLLAAEERIAPQPGISQATRELLALDSLPVESRLWLNLTEGERLAVRSGTWAIEGGTCVWCSATDEAMLRPGGPNCVCIRCWEFRRAQGVLHVTPHEPHRRQS